MDGFTIGAIMASTVATFLGFAVGHYWPWFRSKFRFGSRWTPVLVGRWSGRAAEVALIKGGWSINGIPYINSVQDGQRFEVFQLTLDGREAGSVARGTISLVPEVAKADSFTRVLQIPFMAFSSEFGYLIMLDGPRQGQTRYAGAGFVVSNDSGGWDGFLIARQFHGRDFVLVQLRLHPRYYTEQPESG